MASSQPPASAADDIRRIGQLVKIKTNKKKYFVLRDETKSSSARLEYYDSEKKWRTGSMPKRTIVLKNCFNINSKPDAKHKFAIALYTKDDCFSIACHSEEEQQDWLTTMIELRNRNLDENTVTRPLFEHIWPVTVKSKGLGGNERKVIPGQYRLCLTNKDLSLIRMNNDQSAIILPLDCIRRCGHTHQFFFLELGRSAITGSGSLWLQVEDMVIAQNIHEALLSSMKNNEVPATSVFRGRSGSSATEHRGKRSSMMAPNGGASTLHSQPKRSVSIYTSNPSPKSQGDAPLARTPGNDMRPLLPGTKKPSSESPQQNHAVATSGGKTDGTIEEEPPAERQHYLMINAWRESQSVSHPESSLKLISENNTSPDGLKSSGASRGDEAAAMIPVNKLPAAAVGSSSSWPEGTADYVPMVTPMGESYMVMSTRRADEAHGTGPEAHGSNSSVSSAMSSVGSTSIVGSSERSSISLSHLQDGSPADVGYMEMTSPQNLMERSAGSIRPDIVPCYVRDENSEEFPKRAYSVGSKPVLVPNKPLNNSYIDMSGKSTAKKEAEKSSSAPHLNDDDEKKRELSDLFMELDFNRTKRDVGVKGTKDLFRERASSGGSRELRMKAMSLSTKEAIHRLSIFSTRNKSTADGRRARTSTICQESLRPRTSSFGPSDLRPRSSSGGNACFADVMSRQLHIGSEQSSQDSLRRQSKRSSQESVESGKSDTYMNMNLGKRSTDRLAKMVESDAGYLDMKPGEEHGESNYMKMTPVASTAVSAAAENASSARAGPGAVMRQKLETVKAGSGEDYLEMMPEGSGGSRSQSKVHSTPSAIQPKVKVTKSLGETSSSYMEMAPRGLSSEKTVATKSVKKDVSSLPPKNDNYMEMSVGSGKHGSSSVVSSVAQENHCSSVNTLSQLPNEDAKSSVTFVSSPNNEYVRGSTMEQNCCQKEDTPPPPFELSIPFQSFLLRADRANESNPTIPVQPPAASRSVPKPATTGNSVDALELPGGHVQISYATLDLRSPVDDNSAVPVQDGRGTGVAGRGPSFGQASHQHVYAQIDFGKLEDHHK